MRVTWQAVKQSGCRPSPRSSCSLVTAAPNLAMLFGGVFDEVRNIVIPSASFGIHVYSVAIASAGDVVHCDVNCMVFIHRAFCAKT